MNKKIIILIISIIAVSTLFSGCTEEGKFIGTWRTQPILGISFGFTFERDGKIKIDGLKESIGTWEIEENKLIINIQTADENVNFKGTYSYDFSENEKTLYLEGPHLSITLNKK